MNDFIITGKLKSENCKIDLDFENSPLYIYMKKPLLFLLLGILCAVLGMLPFSRSVYDDDATLYFILS